MNIHYKIGAKVQHDRYGMGIVRSFIGEDRMRVSFPSGIRVMFKSEVKPFLVIRWADVLPGDTVEFEVQGDVVEAKARGEEEQPTVLGFKTTELDGVWDLLSIKKRNPPVPNRFGAKVVYRDKQWVLLYAAMLPPLRDTKHNMIWVEINEHHFNWVGHDDIDREKFEVIFTGWQNL